MAKNNIKKNYIYNLSYQILVLFVPLVTTPYLSRVLGADGVGTYSYIESICSYFTLFATMGLSNFGQREISYVCDDPKRRTIVFWETNIISIFTSSICIVAYIFFAISQKNSSLYLVLIFNILSVVTNITWFFQGLEEFGKIVFKDFIFKFINVAYIFVFIKSKNDLIWYLLGTSVFLFLSNLSLWLYLPKYIFIPTLSDIKPFRHLPTIISLFIPSIAIKIYTVLDKIMIGVITGNYYENGYYELAIKLSKILLAVVTSLATVIVPRIAYHFDKGNDDQVKKYMYKSYQFVLLLGIPICLGVISVSSNFVPWFFGPNYDKVITLLKILSFLIITIGISNVTGMQYFVPTKRQNLLTLTVCIGAVINFLLNIVLIRCFQSIGAAVASVVTEISITCIQLYIVRKELSICLIIRNGKNYYISGIIMLFILNFITPHFNSSLLSTFILSIIGAIIYFALLVILKDDFFLEHIVYVLKKRGLL